MIDTTERGDPAPWPPEAVKHARPGLSTVCSLLAILSAVPLALVALTDRLAPVQTGVVAELGLPADGGDQLSRILLLAGAVACLVAPMAAWLARVMPPWVVLLAGLLAVTLGYWRGAHAASYGDLDLVRTLHGAGAGCLLAATAALVGAASARMRPLLAAAWAAAVVGTAALGPRLARAGVSPDADWHDRLQPYPWLLSAAAVLGLALAAVSVADHRPRLFPRWIDLAALLPLVAGVPTALVALTAPDLPGSTTAVLVVVLLGSLAGIAVVALLLSGGTGRADVPDPAVPGAAASDPAVPDPAVPGAAASDPAVPGAAVPGAAVPGAAVPDPAVPGAPVPGAPVPGAGGDVVARGSAGPAGHHWWDGRGAVGSATAAVAFVAAAAVGPTATGVFLIRQYALAARTPDAFPAGSSGVLVVGAVVGALAGMVGALLPEVARRALIIIGLLAAAVGALALLPAAAGAGASVPGLVLLTGGCGLALGSVLRSVGPLATVVAGALVAVALPLGEQTHAALLSRQLSHSPGPAAFTSYQRISDFYAQVQHSAAVAQRQWLVLLAVLVLGGAAIAAVALAISRSRSAGHAR
jgi:hypothetical protein